MRVVLDTNILISAALKRQSVPAMAAYLVEHYHTLLKIECDRTTIVGGRRASPTSSR
jgi:predicted nucleic acid-binding protein